MNSKYIKIIAGNAVQTAFAVLLSFIFLAYIKILFLYFSQQWPVYANAGFIVPFVLLYKYIKVPVPKIYLNTVFWLFWLLVSVTILFTPLHSSDFFSYYLPNAEYLNIYCHFKSNILPTAYESTFAYPPLEYSIISIALQFAGDFAEPAFKLLLLLKGFCFITLFCYLLEKRTDKHILAGFLFLPLVFSNIIYSYYLDISLVLFSLCFLLYYFDNRKTGILIFSFLLYALLSKYTFLPYFAIFLLFCIYKREKQLLYISFAAIFFALPFFLKNWHYYGNPIFPMLSKISPDLLSNNIAQYIISVPQYNFDVTFFIAVILTLAGTPLPAYIPDIKNKENIILKIFGLLLVLTWIFFLNPVGAGASIRFLYPAILVIMFFNHHSPFTSRLIILSAIAYSVYGIFLQNYLIIIFGLCFLTYYTVIQLFRNYVFIWLAAAILILPVQIYYKKDFSLTESGLATSIKYQPQYLRILKEHPNCLTTLYWGIPLHFQLKNNIYLLHTHTGYNIAAKQNLANINYLFLDEYTIKHIPQLTKNFVSMEKIRDYTLYQRKLAK